MDYRKQYWKLKVQHRELDEQINYACATDPYFDESEWWLDIQHVQKIKRLIDYAYKRCGGNVQPMPENFGKARSIYDIATTESEES